MAWPIPGRAEEPNLGPPSGGSARRGRSMTECRGPEAGGDGDPDPRLLPRLVVVGIMKTYGLLKDSLPGGLGRLAHRQ